MVPIIEHRILFPELQKPVATFVFQEPVITRKRPVTPFFDVAVLDRIMVDVIQRRVEMPLTAHNAVTTAKPNLAPSLIVFYVDLKCGSAVKLALSSGERSDVRNSDENVIMVWKNNPCGRLQ